MGRLCQIAALLLFLATFLTPISEWFDRWDAPGLGNDTEFGLFALVFLLVLVLVLCRLVAILALSRLALRWTMAPPSAGHGLRRSAGVAEEILASPHLSPPLRI